MGIEGLFPFLRKKIPHVFHTDTHLSKYAGKRCAVDVFGFLFKYKAINPDRWLDSFVYIILALKRNQMHPIFVYDGAAPPEKDNEKQKRREQSDKTKNRVFDLEQALEHYDSNGEITDTLREEMKKIKAPTIGEAISVDIYALKSQLRRMKSYIINIDREDINKLSKLIDLSGFQSTTAPGEAEAFCASLCHTGHVDLIISNDSDACVYGAGTVLYDFNVLTATCTEINVREVVDALQFTYAQFVDFCIMCGTDYNENIPKVGPVNAFKLITEHKTIDNLPEKYDKTCLNHQRVRELFSVRYPFDSVVIHNQKFNITQLTDFLIISNCRVKKETVEVAYSPPQIIFEDDQSVSEEIDKP